MKYYTETISVTLAEKLKEKGMPIETEGTNIWCPPYAEIFDWLMEKGYLIVVLRSEGRWCYWVGLTTDYDTYDDTYEIEGEDFGTWHKAANAAIEKALTLI